MSIEGEQEAKSKAEKKNNALTIFAIKEPCDFLKKYNRERKRSLDRREEKAIIRA
jgi:hypothetical protein